jgi:hypothetical protein
MNSLIQELTMFKTLLRKEKPNVYLGDLVIAPHAEILKKTEQWDRIEKCDLDGQLHQSLVDLFSLPSVEEVESPGNNDLALDVLVPELNTKQALELDIGELTIPLISRPKVSVSTHIYNLKTGETKASFVITKKMSWFRYIERVFSVRTLFNLQPIFDKEDMEILLYQGCLKILFKINKQL